MDNESVLIAIGLRLKSPLCLPHQYTHCGESADQQASHGLSCKYSQGRHSHHRALNDIIYRALVSAKISSRHEPPGLLWSDGKRPNGMSIIPRSRGVFVYKMPPAVTDAGAVAAKAESKKITKYAHLDSTYLFVAAVVESYGSHMLKISGNWTASSRETLTREKVLPIPCTEDFRGYAVE